MYCVHTCAQALTLENTSLLHMNAFHHGNRCYISLKSSIYRVVSEGKGKCGFYQHLWVKLRPLEGVCGVNGRPVTRHQLHSAHQFVGCCCRRQVMCLWQPTSNAASRHTRAYREPRHVRFSSPTPLPPHTLPVFPAPPLLPSLKGPPAHTVLRWNK